MELLAVIIGLEALKGENQIVTVYSDSKYVVDAVEKGWLWGWVKIGFKKKKNEDSFSTEALSDPENSLLANLMAYHMREVDGVSFEKCASDLGFMKRTKSWCKAGSTGHIWNCL